MYHKAKLGLQNEFGTDIAEFCSQNEREDSA